MVFGNYTTLTFDDVPEESLVSELKRRIYMRMRIEERYQKLSVRNSEGEVLEMTNDSSLTFYKISEKTVIYLDNLSSGAQVRADPEADQDFNTMKESMDKMAKAGANPKYMAKLGIIQQQLAGAQHKEIDDHLMTVIDGLCDAIRQGQQVADFVKLYSELCRDEAIHRHSMTSVAGIED